MSTPISQLKNVTNNTNNPPPKIDDDPMVQDVINSLVREVKTPENIRSTPIATYQQPPPQYQQQSHQSPTQYQQGIQQYTQNKSLTETWVNTDDAKTAIIIAIIALIILYPTDTSSIYNKFTFLTPYHQYDIFIRTFLLACILYVLFRKFKDLI
jgi:hypothetical protein